MQKSPWFKQFNPHILGGSIRFTRNNVLLISGNSKATTPLGYNIFTAIMDEAAFYLDTDNRQMAEERDSFELKDKKILKAVPSKAVAAMINEKLITLRNGDADFSALIRQLWLPRLGSNQ